MGKRDMSKPGEPKPARARSADCTCECDACPDDCSSCEHEGCDAAEENCGPDCPMDDRAAPGLIVRRATREMPLLSMRAAVTPGTLDEEKRTVEVVWTTGERVLRGYFDRFWEELSLDPKAVRMGRLQSGAAPALNTHSSYDLSDVLGVVESARLEPGRGVATLRFARDDKASAVFAKVKDGILRNVSVGYRIHKMEKVEGGDDQIPVYRAVDWEPYEISMVPIGADAGAGVRAAGTATNPCEFVAEEKKMSVKKEPQGTEPAETGRADNTAGAGAANDETRAAAKAEERGRVLAIQRTGRTLKIDPKVIDEHIAKDTSADKFRELAEGLYEKADPIDIRSAGDHATVTAGASEREKWLRGAGDWILERAAVADLVVEHGKRKGKPVTVDGGEFRGLRMVDLARACLERVGVRTKGMLPHDIIGIALGLRSTGYGAQTTSDFPVLMENVLNKTLLAAYATTPDTWRMFCATFSVSDFRPYKRLRMGSFSSLSHVNEGGEYENKAIPDAKAESIQISKRGNIIALTREALINDDLGAFNQLATMLGRAAKLSIEVDVYALLALNAGLGPTMADGLTLFHATHNNVGTGAAITAASLDADRVILASQRDPSGNEILDLRPSVLVLPIGLGGVARQINDGQYDFDASNKFMIPNRVRGLFQSIVDTPRLSGTRRYLFADPGIARTIEVAFLDGQQEPYMEMQEGFRIDAREWKVRLEFAVGAVDFRGAETNAGTP